SLKKLHQFNELAMATPLDGLTALADRLRAAGRPIEPSALAGLLQGIAAAPSGLAGPEWLELVAPGISDPGLKADLQAFRSALSDSSGGVAASKAQSAQRLADLRAELARRKLDGFIVPRADE